MALRLSIRFACCLLVYVIAGSAQAQQPANAAATKSGIVFLFTGWVAPWLDSIQGTGMAQVAQRVQARGVKVILSDPADWEKVFSPYMAWGDQQESVAIVGFSLGANAAQVMALRFHSEGQAVQTVVTVDGNGLLPVDSNIRSAVNYYVYGDRLQPSGSFTGKLRNVDANRIDQGAGALGHMTLSVYAAL